MDDLSDALAAKDRAIAAQERLWRAKPHPPNRKAAPGPRFGAGAAKPIGVYDPPAPSWLARFLASILGALPGLEIRDETRRSGRATTRRRVIRFAPSVAPARRPAPRGPGLAWRLGAGLVQALGGKPACPVCRRPIADAAAWLCPGCGNVVNAGAAGTRPGNWRPRWCRGCGFVGQGGDTTCPHCGKGLRLMPAAEAQTRARQALAAARPTGPVDVQAYERQDGTEVSAYERARPGEGEET